MERLPIFPGVAKDLNNTLVTIDRGGREEALNASPRGFEDMDFSPDGKLLAMTVIGGQQWNVWIYDLQRGNLNRLTFEGDNRDPMWSADGKRVIYGSTFEGKSQLSVASAILEKEPEPITSTKPLAPPALNHAIRKCL